MATAAVIGINSAYFSDKTEIRNDRFDIGSVKRGFAEQKLDAAAQWSAPADQIPEC
ncbi:MAG: hypothetical protein IKT01_00435 [Eubacteriaceae bacterium]|nr:hypothetical protein [Clostridia bacterium]MBR4394851.1 hypothetical protein [Eubacteriaceae bacterium]